MGFSCRVGLRSVTIRVFDFGGSEVVELAVDALLVEPRHPPARGDLEVIESSPRAAVGAQRGGVAVQLGLEQADGRFRERVVVAVADGADR